MFLLSLIIGGVSLKTKKLPVKQNNEPGVSVDRYNFYQGRSVMVSPCAGWGVGSEYVRFTLLEKLPWSS